MDSGSPYIVTWARALLRNAADLLCCTPLQRNASPASESSVHPLTTFRCKKHLPTTSRCKVAKKGHHESVVPQGSGEDSKTRLKDLWGSGTVPVRRVWDTRKQSSRPALACMAPLDWPTTTADCCCGGE
eukprot:5306816-Amphidinium_carterae.1